MSIVQRGLMTSIRLGLRGTATVAPRLAGRLAYRLFSTPRTRGKIPSQVVEIMARAEQRTLDVGGERIAAYRWSIADGTDRPRVVLAHGWESRAARLAVWVEPLLDAGFDVVAYDAPAHGESTGRRSDPVRFAHAIHAVSEAFGPLDAGVGHSLGAVALILSCAGGHLVGGQDRPLRRLVIVGGADSGVDAMGMFCDILGLGSDFLPLLLDAAAETAGRPVAAFDVHRIFADRSIPTLWFHDRDDDSVPLAAAQRVDAACPHVELVVSEGLGHHAIARDPEVMRRGIAALRRLVAGDSAGDAAEASWPRAS